MAKRIAIVNQKGGVGKTTTCVNLASALRAKGKRVLMCDFDPQANATSGMGVDKTVSKGVYSAVIGELPAAEAVSHTRYGDVLPSNKALAGAGVELIGMERREFLLRDALSSWPRGGWIEGGTTSSVGPVMHSSLAHVLLRCWSQVSWTRCQRKNGRGRR